MKALCWHGKQDVQINEVPEPQLINNQDAIIRVTATAICGSDLHLFNDRWRLSIFQKLKKPVLRKLNKLVLQDILIIKPVLMGRVDCIIKGLLQSRRCGINLIDSAYLVDNG